MTFLNLNVCLSVCLSLPLYLSLLSPLAFVSMNSYLYDTEAKRQYLPSVRSKMTKVITRTYMLRGENVDTRNVMSVNGSGNRKRIVTTEGDGHIGKRQTETRAANPTDVCASTFPFLQYAHPYCNIHYSMGAVQTLLNRNFCFFKSRPHCNQN